MLHTVQCLQPLRCPLSLPKSSKIFIFRWGSTTLFWSLQDFTAIKTMADASQTILSVSSSRHLLAAAGKDKKVRIYDSQQDLGARLGWSLRVGLCGAVDIHYIWTYLAHHFSGSNLPVSMNLWTFNIWEKKWILSVEENEWKRIPLSWLCCTWCTVVGWVCVLCDCFHGPCLELSLELRRFWVGFTRVARCRASRSSPQSECWRTPQAGFEQPLGARIYWPLLGTTRRSASTTRIRTGRVRCPCGIPN